MKMFALPAWVLCLASILPSQAPAAFFFEGLEQFSIRACDPSSQSGYQEPRIDPPGPVVITGTPSRYNTGGVPPFRVQPCEDVRPGKSRPSGGQRNPGWMTK